MLDRYKAIHGAICRNQRPVTGMFDVKSEIDLPGGGRTLSHTTSLLYVAKDSSRLAHALKVNDCFRVVPILFFI